MEMVQIKDLIHPNKDFQTSINIEFDLGNYQRIEDLIPTSTVCHYIQELISPILSSSLPRAKIFVGAYGKGKSHITLTALAAMSIRDEKLFERLIEAYRVQDNPFADDFEHYVETGPRLLPVIISGSSTDISRSFLYALRSALKDSGLETLMPQTNFSGALETVDRWRNAYPETYRKMEQILQRDGMDIESSLNDFDSKTYEAFLSAYPMLTSGSTFDTLANASVIETYDAVLQGLTKKGFSGIYVVYDEFSKYLESSIATAPVSDTKLLQDFAECCNRSSQDKQLHLLLISHKDLANYIDSGLPKEKVDGWRGVSGRFQEIEIYDDFSPSYELISSAFDKDQAIWDQYLKYHSKKIESVGNDFCSRGLYRLSDKKNVTFGCFPLHPVTTFILPRISELLAQNERTLFTFISANEQGTLYQLANTGKLVGSYITPDYVFDYFEPYLKRENFSSEIYAIYRLTRTALSKLDSDSLESRIVKTIALIYLISEFNILPPIRELITRVFLDSGFTTEEVDAAFNHLVDSESIVYLRASDSYIKLKESSGVNIEEKVHDASESIKQTNSISNILNDYLEGRALYPSRHNTEKKILRYFTCLFLDAPSVIHLLEDEITPSYAGDGAIVAVLCNDNAESELVKTAIKRSGPSMPTVVFAIHSNNRSIEKECLGYAAAKMLMFAAGEDTVLRDEYEIVLDDYSEIISRYVADFFNPERRSASYFIRGDEKNGIIHRKTLSEELSLLCDEIYSQTPIINNEVINKNDLSGAALTSRGKILNALCTKTLEPNLGFVGNGQETSIARSLFKVTGVIEDYEDAPRILLQSNDSKIKNATDVIIQFLKESNGQSFSTLYDMLMLPEYRVGMKRGPIPILLALVLREYRDSVCIIKDGYEQPLNKKTFEDIDASPQKYSLSIIDWDAEKAAYVVEVGKAFGIENETDEKDQVAYAARKWFVSLPQFARVSKYVYSDGSVGKVSQTHQQFFKSLNKPVINPNEFLFEELPAIFNASAGSVALVNQLKAEVENCNNFIDNVINVITNRLQSMFSNNVVAGESLSSTIADWVSFIPQRAFNRVLSNSSNRIMDALKNFNPDTETSIMRLAKASVSLRIEDWDDNLYDRFFSIIQDFLHEINKIEEDSGSAQGQEQSIQFTLSNGDRQIRSFDTIICSSRAQLLKNQITSSLDEMGQSISRDEKRQILFDVLKELC